jgi:short-subunit dehydrogenase
MTADLKTRFGPAALVTGASDGIGRAFAEALAERGFDLVLIARREVVLQGLARELIARHGVTVTVIAADLSAPGAVTETLARTEAQPIGLLVAAAGFGSTGAFLDLDPGTEAGMVDLNCRSVVELTHGLGRRMAAQGRGGIVLISSVLGFSGAPFSSTYAATKGFIQSFAEGLAVELRPLGIPVLSVAPGPVASGFAARARMQVSRTDTPETVARASLAALTRGGTLRPGVMGKLLGWSLAMMPRWGRVRVLGQIMKGAASRARG